MKIAFKIKLDKIGKFLRKIPKTLAENSFLTILILFLLSFILGGLVYYKYVFSVKSREPEVSGNLLQLDEKTYREILDKQQEREKKFQEAGLSKYSDPFVPAP